jgi:hypothetical protein
MRTTYKNGHPITLVHCGCDGCVTVTINGVLTHEQGCPDAWRDTTKPCLECGCDFIPDSPRQSICNDHDDDWDVDEDSGSGFDFGGEDGEGW